MCAPLKTIWIYSLGLPFLAGDIREMLGVFANVRKAPLRRCEVCITADGRSFEQFMNMYINYIHVNKMISDISSLIIALII